MKIAVAGTAAALLLLAAGCGTPQNQAGPTESTPPPSTASDVPPPLVAAVPLPEDAVNKAVANLDGLVDDLMKSTGVPGMAVAVVHGGKTVYAKGFGVKDNRNGDTPDNKIGPDTVFQLASVSKSLSATVIAQQVGTDAIGWDTPIVSKLPWFSLSDPVVTQMVTVGDLMSHRSGLPDHAGDELEDLGYDRRYILDHLRQLPLDPFRISYAYTNFGVTAAAEAVAAGAGKSWEDLSDEVLYGPLGMKSTSSRFADYEKRPDKAVGHIFIDNHYEPLYKRDPDAQSPAGGASSSVNDMTRWLAMMLADGKVGDKQVIAGKALLPVMTPQIVSSPPAEPAMRSGFYGYGMNISATSAARMQFAHAGAFELGAATNFLLLPSADVGIVVLTNGTPAGIPDALSAEFADLVQFGEIREDWQGLYKQAYAPMSAPVGSLVGQTAPPNPAPSAPLPSLVGTYNNDYWGPARVTEADGKLTLSMGPNNQPWPLTHWDGNTYTFSFVTENSPPGSISKATFDGNKLVLEYYDAEGKGSFLR